MGRILKWLLLGIGGLIALLALFVVVVLLVVDPNDYRGEIEHVVQQQTGRKLTIDGNIGLSFFPVFGLELGHTKVSDAKGFGDQPFVEVDDAKLSVSVMPLLSGDLELNTIILQRPQIHLVRNAQGKANWTQFGPPSGAGKPAATPQKKTPETPTGGAGGVPAVVQNARLAGVEIRKARVVFEDRQAGSKITVDPVNLTLKDVRLGGDVPISLDWMMTLDHGPAVAGSLSATANVAPDLGTARLKDVELNATASGDSIPAGKQTLNLTAAVDADLRNAVYRVSDLAIQAAGAKVTGNAEAKVPSSGPVVTGQLSVPETNPRDIFDKLGMDAPNTRDADVLKRLEASLQYRFAGGQLKIDPLQLKLDDSALSGNALVRSFAGPAADFDLKLDGINVDRYLPPPAKGENQPASTPGGAAAAGAGELPVEPLRRLDLNGHVHVGQLTVSGAKASDIDIRITARNGKLRVHPLTADLYKGKYSGDVRLDATGSKPVVSLDEKLSGIQAQPLLSDVAGFKKLVGTGNFAINATTSGMAPNAMLEALKGKATFSFSNGTVMGINVAQMIREAAAKLRGNAVPKTDAAEKTDFSTLAGSVTMDGGVVHNKDLDVKTPLLRINGNGSADLLKRTVDYVLTVNVVGTLKGQGGENLDNLKHVPIPLHIKGGLTSPGFSLDLKQAFDAVAKKRVEEKKAEVENKAEGKKKEVEEKAREKVQDKLKGLLGQ
ncbi:MAG TPA: AsmA family protein [Gammaproteobacteria bacterium]|nr:AsmA family protein [Gammaproteobacteria bacterium]